MFYPQRLNSTRTASLMSESRNTLFQTRSFSFPSTPALVSVSANSSLITKLRPSLRGLCRRSSRSRLTWIRTRKPSHRWGGQRRTGGRQSRRSGSSRILRFTPRVGYGLRWRRRTWSNEDGVEGWREHRGVYVSGICIVYCYNRSSISMWPIFVPALATRRVSTRVPVTLLCHHAESRSLGSRTW